MKKVLLHICCGVCSGWPAEKLRSEGFAVTGYFYNPNIAPSEEYERRLEAARRAAEAGGYPLICGEYDHPAWLSAVEGMERLKEGGARCAVCFRYRLAAALKKKRETAADLFATTLAVSPHKDSVLVNAIGTSLAHEEFLPVDFKQQDGFRKSSDFARGLGLYRQNYCGCPFSPR